MMMIIVTFNGSVRDLKNLKEKMWDAYFENYFMTLYFRHLGLFTLYSLQTLPKYHPIKRH